MQKICFVFVGGFIGVFIRFIISSINQQSIFFATTAINFIACILTGLLYTFLISQNNIKFTKVISKYQTFIFTGFLGGLSTLASVNYLSLTEVLRANYFYSIIIIISNMLFGLIGCYFGKFLAERVIKWRY